MPGWVNRPNDQLADALANDNSLFGSDAPVGNGYLTHYLNNEDSDEVCVRIRQLRAGGAFENVKVIYIPC